MADTDASHLIVVAGGESYALPLKDVREVMKIQPLTPVPGGKEAVLGVMNMRGEVVAVLDLRRLFSLDDSRELERFVVVTDGKRTVALAIENAIGVVAVSEESVQERPATIDEQIARFLEGIAILDDRVTGVLDVAKLVEVKHTELAAAEVV